MFDAIQRLSDLTERLNEVRNVSAVLLKNDPTEAATELVTVLQEVNKTFSAFETALVTYLSLRFIDSTKDKDLDELVKLQGGGARTMVGEMRARCSKIGILYQTTLQDWFSAAPIGSSEAAALNHLFRELAYSDANAIIPAAEELATWMEAEVDAVTPLIDAGRFRDAGDRVLAARRQIAPLRRTIGRITGELRDLEIQFTA